MNIRRQQTDFGTPNTSRLGHHVFLWGGLGMSRCQDIGPVGLRSRSAGFCCCNSACWSDVFSSHGCSLCDEAWLPFKKLALTIGGVLDFWYGCIRYILFTCLYIFVYTHTYTVHLSTDTILYTYTLCMFHIHIPYTLTFVKFLKGSSSNSWFVALERLED